ncbi:murein hydrolase activator EnvC family protein [Virgibacillus ndiopensis]|uniref:murein hydrolase activator EnvC family protein n=1 Tax=Virgibacillus ndiopensis TaxID=2004408 RepID=UPI000C08D8EA|nr:peptidoglycan DD-metalloendopeptidase family protein [Virgibacillus ndiopensis]
MKKIGSSFLVVTLLLGTGMLNGNQVEAESIDDVKDEINQMEKDKNQLDNKQNKLDSEKSNTEEKIQENLSKQDTVKTDINSIDQKLKETKNAIKTKEDQLIKTNKEIEQLKKDIKVLKERIKEREKLLKERLRTIQQNGGDMRYLEVILGSKSFGDFISRSTAVNTIMDQDKNIMETHAAEKKELEDKKIKVEEKKAAMEDQKKELESLKVQLNDQMAEKEKLMEKLEEQHESLEDYKISLADEQELLRKQEIALQKAMKLAEQQKAELEQLAKERAAKAKANSGSTTSSGPVITGGNFIWPASGSRSSNFGWRTHPIRGTADFHGGIDIAAASGTPIYASTSGVAMPGHIDGSYGNHVIIVSRIDGQTYTTLYAHMSSYVVGSGQAVKQGDLIGYMGSTGASTGSHLHFEIHKGGYQGSGPNSNVVNPIKYLN